MKHSTMIVSFGLFLFLTFTITSGQLEQIQCSIAIVGAGAGGAFSAMRIAEESTTIGIAPSDVCIFEKQGRVGGRIYTIRDLGDNNDLTVDAGAYRFSTSVRPITNFLIKTKYQLPSKMYNPDLNDGLEVITDTSGETSGYVTFVEKMLDASPI